MDSPELNLKDIDILTSILEESNLHTHCEYIRRGSIDIRIDDIAWTLSSHPLGRIARVFYSKGVLKICMDNGKYDYSEFNLTNPDSIENILKFIKNCWRSKLNSELWKFTRLSLFWISIVIIIGWIVFSIENSKSYLLRSDLNFTAGSYDLEHTIEILEKTIAQTIIYEKPTTSILFYDPAEDIYLYKCSLIKYKDKFQEVANNTKDLPMIKVRDQYSRLLYQYQTEMFVHINGNWTFIFPTGIEKYPYNRHCFVWLLSGLALFGISLFLNRHWFE